MIHVLIVEDDPMARKLFEIILQESDRYIVTAAIESASLAEFYCMTSTVDLILMDVCTALRSSGLEAAAKIKKIYPKKKIIIVTSQPECDFVERARKSGVESFWYKDPSAEHLLDVMDRTMRGESVYPDKLPVLQIGLATSEEFTARELEVLRELTAEIRMMKFPFCIQQHPVAILRSTRLSWMLLESLQEMWTVPSRQMKMER